MNNLANQKNSIGRPKTFDKDEVVKLAMFHFWEHGYDSTSLDDLLKAMGIKKSSFYRTFKSKEEIFSLTLDLYRKETFEWLRELRKEIGTKQTIVQFTKMSVEELQEHGKIRGCLLANSAKECYARYSVLSHQITIEYNALVEFIAEFIADAQKQGEIKSKLDSKKLSIRVLSIYNGIITMIQAGGDVAIVDDMTSVIEGLLE